MSLYPVRPAEARAAVSPIQFPPRSAVAGGLAGLLLLLALLLPAWADAPAAGWEDVQVLRQDSRGVEFLLRPSVQELGITTEGRSRLRVGGSTDAAPHRQFQLALPPGARPVVTLSGSSLRSWAGPVDGVDFAGENPVPLLEWEEVGFHDLRLLVLRLELLRQNGLQATLVEDVRVRVDFGVEAGAGFPSRLPAAELAALVLNPGQAAGWARPRLAARDGLTQWDGAQWVRIPVTREGLYQITPGQLSQLGLDPATLDPRTFKLYGYGGALIPENPLAARNNEFAPRELPALRQHDGDGAFESGERLLFYGRGTSALVPLANGSIGVQDHYYSDTNVYWLLLGGVESGLEMGALADDSGAEPFLLSAVRWRGLLNEHKGYGETSARACMGDVFNEGTRAVYTFPAPLPGVAATMWLEYDFYPTITMPNDLIAFDLNGQSFPVQGLPHSTRLEGELSLAGEQLSLGVERLVDSGYPIRLSWFCPSFEAPARFVDDEISFELPPVPGSYQVNVQDPPATFWLVDVTDFDSLRVTQGALLTDRVKPLTPNSPTGRARRYFGATEAGLRTPGGLSLAQMPDLKAQAGTANLIVIAPAAFADAAQELVDYKNSLGPARARLAVLEDVYSEFNGGVADPGALRNFLRHEVLSAETPAEHALFVGNGHYDYRGLLAGAYPLRMPAWYWEISSLTDADWMVDDWFAQVESSSLMSLSIGRLPANSESEVRAYTRKLQAYEGAADQGLWRNRMLFVGDDEHGENDRVDTFEMSHSQDTEELIRTRVPGTFDVERLYVFNYPTVYNPAIRIREKPQAEARLVEALNEGVALVNYMGHGNNITWTHEYIFYAPRHFQLLQATGRPAIFLAATCSWAEIDLPLGEAFPQQLVNMDGGGAIGVLAATRKTGATSNFLFANTLMQQLFQRDGDGQWPVLGGSIMRAKNLNASDTNRRRYVWLGDPSLRPGFPRGTGHLDNLTSGGQPADTLLSQALAGFSTHADTLLTDPVQDGFNTTVMRQAPLARRYNYDPFTNSTVYHGIHLDYESPGALIFSGVSTLAAGQAVNRFMLPGELGDLEHPAELRCYYQGRTGSGATSDGLVYAELPLAQNPNPALDDSAPTLRLLLNGPQWRESDWVAPNSVVILQVQDSSGVNLTGELGHRIEMEIDGGTPRDLTASFQYDLDDWTRGEARLELPLLETGSHRLRARAFDTFNNPGYAEVEFQVLDPGTPALADVVNFPNPARERTQFTFRLLGAQQEAPSSCDLLVYTVKGRRVASRRLALSGASDFIWSEAWEPRNDQGDPLARGVYFYRVRLRLPALSYSLLDENGQYVVRSLKAADVEATGKLLVD
ncbi:MAG: C25 family cysteine peptidase [Candidatus Delongbacteria bacterium]